MSEFEDTLNAVLSDPKAMDQIMTLAQSLSGGTKEESGPTEEGPAPELLRKGEELAGRITGSSSPGTELLRALEPYLKEERRERLERALKLARTTRLIRTAVSAMGGGKGESGHV